MKRAFVLIVLVLVACGTFLFLRSQKQQVSNSVLLVPLALIPGISSDVLQAQDQIVQIEDPVMYFPTSGVYLFEVEVSGNTFEFAGDPEKILHFVKEVRFVNGNGADWSDKSAQVLKGGRDGVVSIVEGLWGIIRHPIDTAKAVGSAAGSAYDYGKKYANGEVNPAQDFSNFADAFFHNECMSVASESGLNFEELETSQARAAFISLAKYRIGGQASVEVLTTFLTFTKIAEVGKVTKLTKLGKFGDFFKFTALAEMGAARVAKFEQAARAVRSLERLTPLLNPQKIITLTRENALNGRLNKVMYYLRQEELAGHNASESLWRSMKMAGADKKTIAPRTFLNPKMDHAQILKNYEKLKQSGTFDVSGNMEALRHGGSVTTRSGSSLDVNHIVPKSLAPELENSWGNLEYMDASMNRSLGNTLTKDSLGKLQEFRKAGAFSRGRAQEILSKAQG